MAQHFELGFDQVSDGRISLQLRVIPKGVNEKAESLASSEDALSPKPSFKRTTAEIISFVARLAEAAERDDDHVRSETLCELRSLERQSQQMEDLTEPPSFLEPQGGEEAEETSVVSPRLNWSPTKSTASKDSRDMSATPCSDEEMIIPRLRKAHVSLGDRVHIYVGGRHFQVSRDIVSESGLLRKAIARRTTDDASRRQFREPTIHIENDPALFEEILKYLRTGRYPLYWNRRDGFDRGRYAELEAQAQLYKIPKLADWIGRGRYAHAVGAEVVHKEIKVREGQEFFSRHVHGGHVERHVDAIMADTEEMWTCPAGVEEHEGDSTMCEVEGCCGSLLNSSAKDLPEQRIKVGVIRVFTTERTWTVRNELLQA